MVRLSSGVEFARATLFFLNLFFFGFGLALCAFGIYIKVDDKFDIAFTDHINARIIGGKGIETVSIILIVVGISTTFVSGFGCLGALWKNRFLLGLYAICISALIILEFVAFIVSLSSRVSIHKSYESGLWQVFTDAYKNNDVRLITVIQDAEKKFKCCGVNGAVDYKIINQTYPLSCYENQSADQSLWVRGCAEAIIDWVWDELPIISGVVGAILFIKIFGIVSSIALAVAISHMPKVQSDEMQRLI